MAETIDLAYICCKPGCLVLFALDLDGVVHVTAHAEDDCENWGQGLAD